MSSNNKSNQFLNSEDSNADIDEVDACTFVRRNSNASQKSSSDDGGFLSRRNYITARASWRRPLVASPSQLSLQSGAASVKDFLQGLGGLLKVGTNCDNTGDLLGTEDDVNGVRYQNVYKDRNGKVIYPSSFLQKSQRTSRPLHINILGGDSSFSYNNASDLINCQDFCTPPRVSRLFSSSPTPHSRELDGFTSGIGGGGAGLLTSPWAITNPSTDSHYHHHISDLSTVYPNSAERSCPSFSGNENNLRYRSSYELPSLRPIQEESRRINQQHGFVPLQIPSPPSFRSYYHHHHGVVPYYSYRPRTRWYPRHYARLIGRSQSELMSPLPHLNLRSASAIETSQMGLEASPESRSSSSGFGSKNTSNHLQGSNCGSTSEWRLLPPYRPPPPPNSSTHNQHQTQSQQAQAQAPPNPNYFLSSPRKQRTGSPPYTMTHWFDMISRLNAATDSVNLPKSVDVGSVDGHYEFDPSTPTSASSPTGGFFLRDDLNLHIDTSLGHFPNVSHHYPYHDINMHSLCPMSGGGIFHTTTSGLDPLATDTLSPLRYKSRVYRYDNVDARLQAMKEEFYAYRKRQAMQREGVHELESFC